ncbi:MAG: SH3 domain-containing protein [Alphaproteobacteria bacterium]|nr:SH3 domain-containing protein [Alphaproteobacteria bacterium]
MNLRFLFFVVFLSAPWMAWAGSESPLTTGLPLPRFASLQADEANLRTGPGTRYPIEWVYRLEGMPLEITAEYDVWRRVRDWEGSEGWIHKSVLRGRRTGIVIGQTDQPLMANEDLDSAVVAYLQPGVVGEIRRCARDSCFLVFGRFKGYLPKSSFWGAYRAEVFG